MEIGLRKQSVAVVLICLFAGLGWYIASRNSSTPNQAGHEHAAENPGLKPTAPSTPEIPVVETKQPEPAPSTPQPIDTFKGQGSPEDQIKQSLILGRASRWWIAWHLTQVCAFSESPPSTLRVSGQSAPIRIRALWDSPDGGPPADPPFLQEMTGMWEKRVARLAAQKTRMLTVELTKLRSELIAGMPMNDQQNLAVVWLESERLLDREWTAFTALRAQNSGKLDSIAEAVDLLKKAGGSMRSPEDMIPASIFPLSSCTRICFFEGQLDLAEGNKNPDQSARFSAIKKKEFDAWDQTIRTAMTDMEALSEATEKSTLRQIGPDNEKTLEDAFKTRRTLDRQISDVRRQAALMLFAPSDEKTSGSLEVRVKTALQESDLSQSEGVRIFEESMYAKGIFHVSRAKAVIPPRTLLYDDLRFLGNLELLLKDNADGGKSAPF